ncbi:alpha/beta fold hydrolase [Marinomonas balearica]|nr:alpha/beta hydrolase [Marinomonas balearica]
MPNSTAEFISKYIRSGDSNIAYRTIGRGQIICLLPSVARGTEDLVTLANLLFAQDYKVILPEPRGINGSTGPLDNLLFEDVAKDILAVIEKEKSDEFPQAIVAGHAFGSMVARACASASPSSIKAIILLAAGGKNFAPELSQIINLLTEGSATLEEKIDMLAKAFFASKEAVKPQWLEGWSPTLLASQRHIRLTSDKSTWWHAGDAPILDVIGDQDPFRIPEQRMSLVSELGNRVTVEVVSDASHALPDEKPNAVAHVMHTYIKSLNAS